MDIHPPKHPVRSVRDFLFEMFTVTCGILIALTLEQAVEWRRTAILVNHATADFRDEISENRDKLKAVLATEPALENTLSALIAYGEARQAHKPGATLPALAPIQSRRFLHLAANARETAIATQAVAHMPFAQARAVLSAYVLQQSLNDLSALAVQQWIAVAGLGDPSTVPDADLPQGLAAVRVSLAYAGSMANSETRLLAAYEAALKALSSEGTE